MCASGQNVFMSKNDESIFWELYNMKNVTGSIDHALLTHSNGLIGKERSVKDLVIVYICEYHCRWQS